MIDFKKIIKPELRHKIMYLFSFLPDKIYLNLYCLFTVGKLIDFKEPKTYTDKLQYLKIYNKNEEYGKLVDKLAVREYIAKVWGEEHLFPLLGVWESFDEIDFESMPEQFVLKCNHDSGSTKIIKSKSQLTLEDMEQLRLHFEERLKHDFFLAGREYPYKGLPRRIIAEKLMIDESAPEKSIEDYKFFCFNGEPKIMFVATDRNADVKFDFFDMDFNHLDIVNIHPQSGKMIEKPRLFDEMKTVAANLSKGIPHVRIDLYELNGKLYFGEYTFFHGGGFCKWEPQEWDEILGSWF